jgi:hypothetical protein
MAFNVGGIAGVLVGLIGRIFTAISPLLRDYMKDIVKNLEEKAESTPAEIDDVFVDFLKRMLGFDD